MKKLVAFMVVALFIVCAGCSSATGTTPPSADSDSTESALVQDTEDIAAAVEEEAEDIAAAVEEEEAIASAPIVGHPDAGAQIFSANCIACHAGGGNIINPTATLSQADLEANGRYSVEAIIYQVTNGGGGMAAFGAILGEQGVADVSQYVYDTATADAW